MRKFARDAIAKYPSIAKLNESISGPRRMGSMSTVEAYIKGVRRFVSFLGLEDPEITLDQIQKGNINIGAKVDEFIDKALEKYSHASVRGYLFGVKKWLELNDVKLDWEKIEMPTSAETSEVDRAPSKEDLKLLLNHARGTRDRAAIFILSSSGLRIGTLLSLKVGDVDFNSYPDVARIKVERRHGRKFVGKRRGTQGRVYFTFITPEAKKALQEYLEERKRGKKELTSESPLIATANFQDKFLAIENFERTWYRLLCRAGLAQKSHRWYQLHVHTLRKYFRSNCVGIDPSYRESWMGHKGGYLDESYFLAEEDRHIAEYRKAIPHLSVYATGMEQKKLVAQAMKAFAAGFEGVSDEQLKRIEEVFARAKDVDEAIEEFRKFKKDDEPEEKKTMHNGNGKYLVAKSEEEMIQRLHDGYKLVQSLNHDKYLLEAA